jgi:hypothetical protein
MSGRLRAHRIDGQAGDRPALFALRLVRNQVSWVRRDGSRILWVRFGGLAVTRIDRYPSVPLFALVLRSPCDIEPMSRERDRFPDVD